MGSVALRLAASIVVSLPSAAQDAPPPSSALPLDRAQRIVRAGEARLKELGLGFEAPVEVRALAEKELVAAAAAELESWSRPGWFEARARLRSAFGLAEATSADALLERTAAARANAFVVRYDSRLGALVYDGARAVTTEEFEREARRQLVLAWRDRRTPLAKLAAASPRLDADAMTVQLALRAGEAEALAMLARDRSTGATLPTSADGLARPLALSSDDPLTSLRHLRGREFVLSRARGDRGAFEALYASPPASSEQLSHAEKLGRDEPREVAFPQWSEQAGVAAVEFDDQLGELGLVAVLLESGADLARARLAAIGWDGDRMQILRNSKGETAQIWRLYFDRPEDLRQFVELWRTAAPGRLVTRAVTCDWVRSDSVAFAKALGDELASAPPLLKPVPEDQASTAAAEQRLAAELDDAPRLEGSLWSVPRLGFSMRVPESWSLEDVDGVSYVFAPQVGAYRDNVSVAQIEGYTDENADALLERHSRIVTEQPGLEMVLAEKRVAGGREGVFLRYRGSTRDVRLEFAVLLVVRESRVVAVTCAVSAATWPQQETLLDAALRTVRFDPASAGK